MKIVYIILAVIAVLVIGWFMVDFINAIPIETVEQAAEVAEETEITEFQDKLRYILGNILGKVIPVFITVIGIRFSIKILHATISGC